MSEDHRHVPRVLVAAVSHGRGRSLEESVKVVSAEVTAARLEFVRSVVVKGEVQYIQQLVSNVSNDNHADAIVLIGGTGIGPHDATCEALSVFLDRHIEGFAEAYRRLLRDDLDGGPGTLLVRAAAGVYNQCVVFALNGSPAQLRRAMTELIAPTLREAVQLATGRAHVHGADSIRIPLEAGVATKPRPPGA